MLRTCLPCLLACCAAVSLSSAVEAARVKVWHQHQPAQYAKARLEHVVISSEGTLRLSRQLEPLATLEATHVWDIVDAGDGSVVAATGPDGKIFKVTPEGKVTLLHAGEHSQVLCLARAADGSIFAGTGPGGEVLRIDPQGQVKVFCTTGESYVWSLAIDPRTQALHAGTGPHGRILRIAEGKAETLYKVRQDHVLALAASADGMLYAGTDRGGLVYRIDGRGKGFVLYQAAQPEIHNIRLVGDAVYVGTSAPTRRQGGTASSARDRLLSASADRSIETAETVGAKKKDPQPTAAAKKPHREEAEEGKGTPASAPSAPASGENSVYRISPDGTVREVFREKAMVLSMLRQGEHFFVGTGMDGQLFEVNEASRERSEIARLDLGQILSMCRRQDGAVLLGTGDPGKLYVLRDRFTARGTMVSEVLDAKIISRWGALGWEGRTPEGTSLSIAVRSGNVAEPDETWSDWSAEETDPQPQQATITAPPARFLQYRVTLATTNPAVTPSIQAVTLRYASTNQAPEITKVEAPDLNAVNLENPKKLKLHWTAVDPNEDELTYQVHVRKEGWKSWVLLEDDLDKTDFEWDTTTTPSGLYRFKVTASDHKDNPESETLTAERISEPFVVSHTPPTVAVKTAGMDGEQVIVEARASSPLVRLTSASFAVNGKKWTNVFPTDGMFDSKSETFRFKTEPLQPGTYVLVLRVRDAAGNNGSSDIVFDVHPRAAADK